MPCNGFFALGILCTHRFCWAVCTQIRAAFVFAVAIAVCGRIMQRLVFRTNHIVKVFIVNIYIPRMVAIFGFGACIGRSQNSAAFKDSFADPRGFVGAVGSNDFVFGVVLVNIIVQGIKCYAVVNISGRNIYT